MEVRSGYMQTELGLIPADWVIKTVGEISEVKTGPFGSALHEKDYVNDGTPIITVEHLGERGVIHENLPMVSDVDKTRLKAYSLIEGDIVFSRVGSVDRNALIGVDEEGWLFSGRLLRVRLKGRNTDSSFLSYHFHSEAFKQRVKDVAVGQTMASINTQILMGVKTILPPTLLEQEAIAEALSDADALIESLERLIAKKRQVKQGAMQELLTGKRRLLGLSGEWERKSLRLITKIPVTDGPHSTPQFLNDGVPFLSVNNLVDNRIDFTELRYISKEDDILFSKKCKPQKNDILLGKAASVGKVAIVDVELAFNIWSPLALIRINESNHPRFVYYYLQSSDIERQIIISTNSSSQGNLGMGDIEQLEILLPSLKEQIAIATVLSDIDAEIAAVEEKLAKARQIKQGMMQELLTGRIRLI